MCTCVLRVAGFKRINLKLLASSSAQHDKVHRHIHNSVSLSGTKRVKSFFRNWRNLNDYRRVIANAPTFGFCRWRSMTPLIPPMCFVDTGTPLILRITLDTSLILPIITDATLVLPTMINTSHRSHRREGQRFRQWRSIHNVCVRSIGNDRISSVTIDRSMTVNSTNDGLYKRRRSLSLILYIIIDRHVDSVDNHRCTIWFRRQWRM